MESRGRSKDYSGTLLQTGPGAKSSETSNGRSKKTRNRGHSNYKLMMIKQSFKDLNKLGILFLNRVLVKNGGLLKISPDFEIKGLEHVKELVSDIENLVKCLPMLSDTGYINKTDFNIPMVDYVAQVFLDKKDKVQLCKMDKIDTDKRKNYSVAFNKVVHNMILLFLLYLITKIELWFADCDKRDDMLLDVAVDIKNLKRSITLMIHPFIKSKLGNRGISIILNGFSGYDTEYYTIDEPKKLNVLLSGQIAANTAIYLRVPVVNVIPLHYTDISRDDCLMWGDTEKVKTALPSMDFVISSIRAMLYSDHDKLLEDIVSKFEVIPYVSKINMINGDVVFAFPKTERRELFKLFQPGEKYSSIELMNVCDNLVDNDLEVSLTNLMALLGQVSGKDDTDKMKDSIKRCINQPSSRIIYKFKGYSDVYKVLSISVKRVMYIMMHFSPAELSMLSDFESFKEELDMIQGLYVTRGKPLKYKVVKSHVHIRDTELLAPPGSKSLAAIGSIYAEEGYKKVDLKEYRGKMKELLKEKPDLFKEYGMMDAYITLKHGNRMEEFYLSLSKLGVPLTSTGISKSYVFLE